MSQEKIFFWASIGHMSYRFIWCFGAWLFTCWNPGSLEDPCPSRSFSRGDRPMLLIFPLVLGDPRADDLGPTHSKLRGGRSRVFFRPWGFVVYVTQRGSYHKFS